jgi:hypothetical protein
MRYPGGKGTRRYYQDAAIGAGSKARDANNCRLPAALLWQAFSGQL